MIDYIQFSINNLSAFIKIPAAFKLSKSFIICLLMLIVGMQNMNGATRTASVTGNWSSTATWGGAAVPTSSDDVSISINVTVTIDAAAACGSMTIAAGTLKEGGAYTLTVSGNWTNNGTFANNGRTINLIGSDNTIGGNKANNFFHLTFGTGASYTSSAAITTTGTLTLNSGSSLSLSGLLTLNGDFTNNGGTVSGSGGVTIGGPNFPQSIGSFATTGPVTMNKTYGSIATLTGNVSGGALIINGNGTLNLGAGLTHTFNGVITLTAGYLNGGSSMLNVNTTSTTAWNGTGSFFSAGTGTVNFGGAAQTLSASATTFNNLILNGSGTKTLGSATNISGDLTVKSGITLQLSTFLLTLNGNLFSDGAVTGGAGGVTIGGLNSNQSIGSFTTTGTVSMTKILGVATLKGNVNGAGLTINGMVGTLNLGAGLTHTFMGTWTMTSGTLLGNSSTLQIGGAESGTGGTFAPGTGTIAYTGIDQTVYATTYYNLALSGSGIKTFNTGIMINGNLEITSGVTADLKTGSLPTSNSLTLSGALEPAGTYGGNNSSATYILPNFAYGTTSKGMLTVGSGTITTGTITGSPFCVGTTVSVPYTIPASFTSGNIFTAQLSDATGSFSSTVSIGTLTSTDTGTIRGTIPSGTIASTKYRIRVVSSNPVVTGIDNGIDLTVNPTVTINPFTLDTSTRCQEAGTVTTTTTANNSYGITYSLDAITAGFTGNSIVSTTGAVTYAAGWSGSTTIIASAAGCGTATTTFVVTTTPTVTINAFSPAASSRCQGAGAVTTTTSASNYTSISYSLDAITAAFNGNSIDSSTGTVTYAAGWSGSTMITASAAGCDGPSTTTFTETTTPTVTINAFLSTTSTRCQGAGSVTTKTTANNSTGVTYSLDAITAGFTGNSIDPTTGAVTYAASWSGTTTITASASGCGTATTTFVEITTPPVATPVFTLGDTSTRCQGTGTELYTATASDNTGITYTLDATSILVGNSINSETGAVSYSASWSGTTIITASADGCYGPKTATHIVTVNPTIPVSLSISASANPVYEETPVTFTATPTNEGTSTEYQWQLNGTNVGTNSATYSYTPKNKDAVSCILTSNVSPCGTSPATSNIVTVNPNKWTGANGTSWNTEGNWQAGHCPGDGYDIEFDTNAQSDLYLDQDRTIGNLINYSAKRLVIPPTLCLTVTDSIQSDDVTGDRIYIKSSDSAANGSLIFHNKTTKVYGTVEMYSKAFRDVNYKWQFFGIPVQSVVANPTFYGSYVRRWEESGTTSATRWIQLGNASVLNSFAGYEITQQAANTFIFQGQLVNDDFNPGELVYTSGTQYAGQHIFANPYTAAIDINKLSFGDGTDKTVYLYNTGSYTDWETNNGESTPGNSPGQYTAVPQHLSAGLSVPSIPSMQGFLVKVMDNNGIPLSNASFSIPYAAVATPNKSAQRARGVVKTDSPQYVFTRIDVTGAHYSDCMWIFTEPACTHSFDNGWDGQKFIGPAIIPQLFAMENDGIYQVDAVDDVNGTNLGFVPGVDTNYTLTFTHTNIRNNYAGVYLMDNVKNKTIDITQSGSTYSFSTSASDSVNRFTILTRPIEQVITGNEQVKIFNTKGTVLLQNFGSLSGEVMIYDVAGHFLKSATLVPYGGITVVKDFIPGVYIVKAATGKKGFTKQIIVQ